MISFFFVCFLALWLKINKKVAFDFFTTSFIIYILNFRAKMTEIEIGGNVTF